MIKCHAKIKNLRVTLPLGLDNFTSAQQTACLLEDTDHHAIITYSLLKGEIMEHYPFYTYTVYYSGTEPTDAECATDLFNKWEEFLTKRGDNIIRAYEAMIKEYDPLYNYDRYETGKETNTINHGKKVSTNTDLKVSTNTDLKDATKSDLKSAISTDTTTEALTDGTTTYNRPTWSSQTTATGQDQEHPAKMKTSGSENANYTRTTADDEDNFTHRTGQASSNYQRSEGDDTDNYTEESGTTQNELTYDGRRTYGNIGVTTSQQMLQSEIDLRKYDFIGAVIREFVESIAYYVGDDELMEVME